MCEVLFITPNMKGNIRSEAMGTLQLASILKEKKINCKIVPFYEIGDISNFSVFLENTLDIVEKLKPKIISFYTRCDIYHIELMMAKIIKEKWPNIYMVCGGPQSDITAVATIDRMPFIDYVCCGEGERTIYPFFSSLLEGKPDNNIPGLTYCDNGQVKQNPRPQLIEDLDELPILDYTFFSIDIENNDDEFFPIEVGRGCPFGCTFCSTNAFWGRKYRLKSPSRIIEEIKCAHKTFGATKFKFTHDMFTLNRNKVIETCELLKKLDFRVEWKASSRIDCLDEELIDIMADSGMVAIFLGIESGSPRMQKLINKNLNLEFTGEIIDYMVSKGIEPITSFIYGFPEETEEDLSQTLALIGRILCNNKVSLSTHLCAFFVGTELSSKYADEMVPVDYYSNETGEFAVSECMDLIKENPSIFTHMFEYKTELRQRLKYFEVFLWVWILAQPVYQYISEKYNSDNMIDMYFGFVEANRETLEKNEDDNLNLVKKIVKNDKFIETFNKDKNYDIISDFYSLYNMANSAEAKSGETLMDVFCFDINSINKYHNIKDYPRGKFITVCKNGKFATFPKQ